MHTLLKNHTFETDHIFLVVTAKEEGKIYELTAGQLHELEHVREHPPTYSDNEGFFERSGNGITMGSGNVRETDDQHNITAYLTSMAEALSKRTTTTPPRAVLVVEPEHLNGKMAAYVSNPNHIPIETVLLGNYVQHTPHDLAALLQRWYESDYDPTHPDSVAGEENAEEKRKILNVAMARENIS